MILPNQLTVARIVLTPVFLFFFLMEEPVYKQISIVIFAVAAITDWYDGWLARKYNYITDWGKFLDPLADKILTSTAFFAFVAIDVLSLWMIIVIVTRDVLITTLRFYAEFNKHSFATSRSAKWKTLLQMAFLYYLLLLYVFQTIEPFHTDNIEIFNVLTDASGIYWTMFLITMFTIYTGLAYLYKNRFLIKKIFSFEAK